MIELSKISVRPNVSLIEVIEILDKGAVRIVLVTDEACKLLGVVTDGDIRRTLLKKVSLDTPVKFVMNENPVVLGESASEQEIISLMRMNTLIHVPIVDGQGRVVRLEIIDDKVSSTKFNNSVVLMAGGLGSRLGPLTADCPKPMLQICGKPILEIIVDRLIDFGFHDFFISVNYKANIIQQYFGDGSSKGISLKYIKENKPLGTAGALSLLSEINSEPLLIMNADVLTNVNFPHLLDFHARSKAVATMCVKNYDSRLPYGVVQLEENRIKKIIEKPQQTFFVNAGVYVLDKKILELIPKDARIDMPNLFEKAIQSDMKAVAFPIREYWNDIGHKEDYELAHHDYSEHFLTQ